MSALFLRLRRCNSRVRPHSSRAEPRLKLASLSTHVTGPWNGRGPAWACLRPGKARRRRPVDGIRCQFRRPRDENSRPLTTGVYRRQSSRSVTRSASGGASLCRSLMVTLRASSRRSRRAAQRSAGIRRTKSPFDPFGQIRGLGCCRSREALSNAPERTAAVSRTHLAGGEPPLPGEACP